MTPQPAPGASRPFRGATRVLSLDARRIENALAARARYKYVQPRVEREGLGWKVVSPNCSRNVDPAGGEIDIAWLVPVESTLGRSRVDSAPPGGLARSDRSGGAVHGGGWLLFSRDHAQDCWQVRRREASLSAALAHLCADPDREFWQ
jgi:hypothetical protein